MHAQPVAVVCTARESNRHTIRMAPCSHPPIMCVWVCVCRRDVRRRIQRRGVLLLREWRPVRWRVEGRAASWWVTIAHAVVVHGWLNQMSNTIALPSSSSSTHCSVHHVSAFLYSLCCRCAGKGIYTSIVGSSYDGEWLDGNRHGIGIMTFKDGSTYNGHWMHGQKHGRGELTMVTGFRYRGGWDRDSMQGKCEMSYPDGSKYEGACLNGKREGRGTYLFTDGQHLSGKWCNDNIDPALTSGSLHMPKAVWTVVNAADIDTAAASNSNVGTSEAADAGAAPGSQSRGEEASLQHNQPQQSQRRMSVQGGRSTGGGFECMIPIHLENDTFNKIHLRAGFDKTGQ